MLCFRYFFITNGLVATIGGGLVCLLYYNRPNALLPIWQLGKSIMFFGVINMVIIITILIQHKKGNKELQE